MRNNKNTFSRVSNSSHLTSTIYKQLNVETAKVVIIYARNSDLKTAKTRVL